MSMVFTIGHSNRSWEDFLALLEEFGIRVLADVRRYPSSRKFPHFNRGSLSELLSERGIHYAWFEALGGRRHKELRQDSPNRGLKSPGFRAYADYMLTPEFQKSADRLLALASRGVTAVMCAEKFYWKCHRRLLSDYLYAQGVKIVHILEPRTLRPHRISPGTVICSNRACSKAASPPATSPSATNESKTVVYPPP